ncbi:hypothetical protein BJ944DRAFT_269170 [Cunninghamella echinulata]|nr:hypothetical protein BJ944DRAFT_269170 [Cunninghamella echinulata]
MLDNNKTDHKHGSKLKRILHGNNNKHHRSKTQDLSISSPVLQHSTNIYSLTSPTRASFEIKNNVESIPFYDLYQPLSPPPPIPTSLPPYNTNNINTNTDSHNKTMPSRNNSSARCDTNCLSVTPNTTRGRRRSGSLNQPYGPTLAQQQQQYYYKKSIHPLDNDYSYHQQPNHYIKTSLDIPRDSRTSLNNDSNNNNNNNNNNNTRSSSLKNLNQKKNLRRHSCTSTVYHQQQQIQQLQQRYQQQKLNDSNQYNVSSTSTLSSTSTTSSSLSSSSATLASSSSAVSPSSFYSSSSTIQNASPAAVVAVAAVQSHKKSSKLYSKVYQKREEFNLDSSSSCNPNPSSLSSSCSSSFRLEKSKSTPLKSHSKIKTYNVQSSNSLSSSPQRHTSTSTPRRKHGSSGGNSRFSLSQPRMNPSLQLERDLEKRKRQQELEDLISGRRGSTLKLTITPKNTLLN